MFPLVSIIIPVYNSGTYLKECIDSAIGQSYQNIEIIVVDDGSTDGCADFLRSHVHREKNVHLFDQINKGACAARNLGISQAKGEYIQFLDADDLLSYEKIEKQINLLDGTKPNMIATCEWVKFSQNMENYSSIPYGIFQNFSSGMELLLRFWNFQEMMANSSYLTPRDLIDRAGPWDETLRINQDGEYFTRVLLRAERILFEPEVRVYYRQPGGFNNVSKQRSEKACQSLLKSYQAYERNALEAEDSLRVRIAIKKVYRKFIYDVYPEFPSLTKLAEKHIEGLEVSEKSYIGGPKFQYLSKIFGFKNAIRLKRYLQPK